MDNFAAIDFETANNERTSICSVGVVIVRNGEIADRFYSLVHPEPDYYLYWKYGSRVPLKERGFRWLRITKPLMRGV